MKITTDNQKQKWKWKKRTFVGIKESRLSINKTVEENVKSVSNETSNLGVFRIRGVLALKAPSF